MENYKKDYSIFKILLIIPALLLVLALITAIISCDPPVTVPEKDLLSSDEVAWIDTEPMEEIDILDEALADYGTDLKQVVIHCTATPPSNTWGPERLKEFFRDSNGWSRPGYLYYITYDGTLHPLWYGNFDCYVEYHERTNGARGENSWSIHIAYQGGVDKYGDAKDTRTPEQKLTIANVIKLALNSCPGVEILGHTDLEGVSKACPSFDVQTEYSHLL